MIPKKILLVFMSVNYFALIEKGMCEDMSDQYFLDHYDEVIEGIACGAIGQTQGSEMKINVGRYSTREELAKMAFWNYGNDFSSTRLEFDEDLKWKRDFVDTIFDIFNKSCPSSAVPEGYMNIFREFTMIYLNSVEPRTSNSTVAWENIQILLDSCKSDEKLQPYDFVSKAMKVTGIRGKSEDMTETTELFPPEEKVDVVYTELDQVVENFWWVFSHAMGKCYPMFPRPAEIAPKLKAIFVRDFLRPLLNRWGDPGPLQDFGPIVGNYNVALIQRNIRYCVTAAYFLNGITELQMVRPLRVGYVHEGRNSILNRKTGATFM